MQFVEYGGSQTADMDTDTGSDTSDQPQLSGIVEEGEVSNYDQESGPYCS